jgi:uncharacterized protein
MTPRKARRSLRSPWLGLALALVCSGATLQAQTENLPPKPTTYVTDQAHLLDPGTVQQLDQQLDQFERDTSNQVLVAIYPSLPVDADPDQYSIDAADSWQVGQKGKDNGAVLFIYVNDRKMFICPGRGLEGALPDAICKNIVTQVIAPAFKQQQYAQGVQAGVNAMLAATKGEYQGNGSTDNDAQDSGGGPIPVWVIVLFIVLFILAQMFIFPRFRSGPFIYTGGGWGGGGFGGSGGFGGGGGSFGGGGGGFTSGGGSFGGGGAGGSW